MAAPAQFARDDRCASEVSCRYAGETSPSRNFDGLRPIRARVYVIGAAARSPGSKVGRDAFILPIAIAGGFRTLRALKFAGAGLGLFGSAPVSFGAALRRLGKRSLRSRRQRLSRGFV